MGLGLGRRGGHADSRFAGAHALVTGGSQGIGLALAHELLARGASVTLVSRSRAKLDAARAELLRSEPAGRVHAVSADVTQHGEVVEAVREAERRLGPVDLAVCCAGAAHPGRFVEQELRDFRVSMELDYFGSLHVAKAVLPGMLQRDAGHLMFVASPLAAIGFVGYASYAPAKFAVRGLADVLRNELAGTKVRISIGYPLDTATAGFDNENLTKPPETEQISRLGGAQVLSAQETARTLMRGLERGQYHIRTSDFGVNLLLSSMSSVTPKLYPFLLELLLAPITVVAQAVYRRIIDGVVVKARRRRQAEAAAGS